METVIHIPHDIMFSLATVAGMIGHYAKKKVREETVTTLTEWFGSVNIFGTISSITTASATILGALSSGVITPEMTDMAVIYIGLTNGFAVDSATNGDSDLK